MVFLILIFFGLAVLQSDHKAQGTARPEIFLQKTPLFYSYRHILKILEAGI